MSCDFGVEIDVDDDPAGITVDQWITDHAYAPDDIVLGDQGLTPTQLSDMWALLDLARPGWRDLLTEHQPD